MQKIARTRYKLPRFPNSLPPPLLAFCPQPGGGNENSDGYLEFEDIETPIQEVVCRDVLYNRLLRIRRYPRPHRHQLQKSLAVFFAITPKMFPRRLIFRGRLPLAGLLVDGTPPRGL